MPVKQLAPLLFRFVAVLAIAWFVQASHKRATAEGARPILLSEVAVFLPNAERLRFDAGERRGRTVLDGGGGRIGYAARTMPDCRKIKGYSGPTDTLLVFDAQDQLLGISVRHSYDTPSHVEDVTNDYLFMEQWNGKTWTEIGGMTDLKASKIYGVSGASRTSIAMAHSVAARTGGAGEGELPFRPRWQDLVLCGVVVLGGLMVFVRRGFWQKQKTIVQALMVVYLGLITGDLLAQSLIQGWATHGVPWRSAPGLLVLAAVAMLVPWSTGKRIYCTEICPHGHLQRWLTRWVPAQFKVRLGTEEKNTFRIFPGLLLTAILVVVFLRLPLDLAGFEAFDAWAIKGVGVATVAVFAVGLIYSAFVPMGYCRHACPTGFMLDLVKRERAGFVKRDLWLLGLFALSAIMYFAEPFIRGVLFG